MHPCTPVQKKVRNKNIQLDFKNIPQNNRQQFLQFLIKNNIKFQKFFKQNHCNYIAKIIFQNNCQHLSNKKLYINHQFLQCNKNKFLEKSAKKLTNNSIQIKKNIDKINLSKKLNKQSPISQHQQSTSHKNENPNKSLHTPKYLPNKYKNNDHNNISTRSNQTNKKKDHHLYQPKSARINQFYNYQHHVCQNNYIQSNHQISNIKSSTQKTQKTQYTNKKQPFSPTISANISRHEHKQQKSKQRQKISQINNKIKQKTEFQKQITLLFNRLLKLFQLKLQGQKLIKLSFHQLIQIIQNIYQWIFLKNIADQRKNQSHWKQEFGQINHHLNNHNPFAKLVKQFFINKFNHQKQAISNLINMLYSLALYLQVQKKHHNYHNQHQQQQKAYYLMTSNGIYIKTFQNFICNIYQIQDLLFYLFIRNIIINQLNIQNNFPKIKIQKTTINHQNSLNQIDLIFNLKDINKILKQILYNDQQLIKQYTSMIIQHIKLSIDKQNISIQQIIKISCPQLIILLLDDYKKKRLMLELSIINSKHSQSVNINLCSNMQNSNYNNFQGMLKKTFPKYSDHQKNRRTKSGSFLNDNQTNQLTFGQQTQDNIQQLYSNIHTKQSFWQPILDYQLSNKYKANSIEGVIFYKMKKKVRQFINILIENKSEYNSIQGQKQKIPKQQITKKKQYWYQLLIKKSMSLLKSIIQMNKIQWFDDLRVKNPSQQDVDKVQQLQLAYRKIKDKPQPEQIAKLCKNILTTHQLTSALEKLMNVESQTTQIF